MSLILDLKKYLSKNAFGTLYHGDVNNESVDDAFINSVKDLENKISELIGNNSFKGLIVNAGKINNNISINDIKRSVTLIKSAQAVYDNLVPADEMMDPTAIVLINNPSKQLEEPDPADNQRQGIANDVRLPEHMDPLQMDDDDIKNMDERVEWMMSLQEK